MQSRSAALRWGSAIGPVAFVIAWAMGGLITDREYDPARDTISRLARVGGDVRWLMTAGMITFGVMVTASAIAWRRALPGRGWMFVGVTGIATLGVAATPLEWSELVDRIHLVTAGIGYVTLAAVPVAAFRPLCDAGLGRFARIGVATSAIATISLAISLGAERAGLFQRIGLTVLDLWLVCSVPMIARLLRS